MRRMLTVGVLLAGLALLLLVGGATACHSTKTLIVDDTPGDWRDYANVQDAVDNASSGDTIRVYEGIYFENVVVEKYVKIIGNGSDKTEIDGNGMAVTIRVRANCVRLENMRIFQALHCVHAKDVSGLYIRNCEFDASTNGVTAVTSYNIQVTGSHFHNMDRGFVSASTNSVYLRYNTFEDHEKAVYIVRGRCIKVYDNDIGHVYMGVYVAGSKYVYLYNNDVSNMSIGLLVSQSCSGQIWNNDLYSGRIGIEVGKSSGFTVKCNFVEDTVRAFKFYSSSSLAIQFNTVELATKGMTFGDCTSVCIYKNKINNTSIGIFMDDVKTATVRYNEIRNSGVGLKVRDSTVILVQYNKFEYNTIGVWHKDVVSLTINLNTFTSNGTDVVAA